MLLLRPNSLNNASYCFVQPLVNQSPSEKTVYNSFAEFCRGRDSVSDE